MEIIPNIEDLCKLHYKERFYVIKNGHCLCYVFASLNPVYPNWVIAISLYNHLKSECFNGNSFTHSIFMKGKYSSNEIGKAMIDQYKAGIESIEQTYLKPIN